MSQRKAITAQTVARYRRATQRQKAALLNEFVQMHGCTRHHAAWVLRMWGKTVFERRDGQLAVLTEHEIADRARRRFQRHLREAQLPAGKTLDSFDSTPCRPLTPTRPPQPRRRTSTDRRRSLRLLHGRRHQRPAPDGALLACSGNAAAAATPMTAQARASAAGAQTA